jgi:ZIP family zinc transporter
MTATTTVVMGALAGNTVFIGLPVARLRWLSRGAQGFCGALATGILLFLLWDVLTNASGPIDDALPLLRRGVAADFVAIAGVFVVGMAAGLLTIVYVNRWLTARGTAMLPAGRGLAALIALGLGLHNFSEGLAIGQAAVAGGLSFAAVLIIGFGLHNATEGFGIAAPIVHDADRPSWRFLLIAGTVAGGPTLLGTVVGYHVVNRLVFVLFLALAAGTLVYVINEMLHVGRKLNTPAALAWGLLLGFLAGYGSDLLITLFSV